MRRATGGLMVGAGLRRAAISRGGTRAMTTCRAEEDASVRMRSTTTIVPIAKATPTHSATTTALASVSLPAWSL